MKDTPKPEGAWPWLFGWTFSVPVDELFRDTASALNVTLDAVPFNLTLSCQQATAGLHVSLPANATDEIRTSAEGIRIRYRSTGDGEEHVISCAMISTTTMVIEADEPCLRFITGPELERTPDGSGWISSQGAHRLVLVEQPGENGQTVRAVVLSGAGDPAILVGLARAALATSAHEVLGRAWWPGGVPSNTSFTGAPPPLIYLRSLFRPASVHLPAPWLAGPDGEPVWSPTALALAIHSLIEPFPQLAAALIQNLIELIDDTGGVPAKGGFRSPPTTAPMDPPILLSLFMDYHRHTGTWAMDVDQAVAPLSRYIERHLAGAEAAGTAPWLLQRELVAWDAMYRLAGRPYDAFTNRVRMQGRAVNPAKAAATDATAAGILLAPDGVRSKGRMNTNHALDEIGQKLTKDPSVRFPTGSWCLAVMITDRLAQANHPAEYRWVERVAAAAGSYWTTGIEAIRAEGRMDAIGPDGVAIAAAHAWAETTRRNDRSAGRKRTALAWWLNRRRKPILIISFVMLILFIGWLTLVQFRVSMPVSVFKTEVGLLLQHYHQGEYETALTKAEEIKQRGHPEHPAVWMIQGRSLFQLGRYEEAIEAFAFAAERQPLDPAPRYNAALARFRLRGYEQAAAEFNAVAGDFARSHPSLAARARRAAQISLELQP